MLPDTTSLLAEILLKVLERFSGFIMKNPKVSVKLLQTINPELLEKISKRKAVLQLKRAAKKVPFYKIFLKQHKIKIEKLKSFSDFKKVPLTTKENYITKCRDLSNLFVDGKLSSTNLIYKSSGYTGKALVWAHNLEEGDDDITYAKIGLESLFSISKNTTLLINGFALGSWVSGMKFALIMSRIAPTINPGANQDEILELINFFCDKFDQLIVSGYPPFIKNLVELGLSKGINFRKYNINFLLAGEGFSESFRDYLYTLIGSSSKGNKSKIYSIYGAADIGVSGINENDDTVMIRKAAEDNESLKYKLFGKCESTPMLFQYNLMNFFIEQNFSGELVITKTNLRTAQPLIRYNIHDLGGVISYRKMQEILDDEGVDIKIKLALPFVYVTGRNRGTISINAAKIYPETIHKALYKDASLARFITGRFKMRKEYTKRHDEKFIINIELKEGVTPSAKLKMRLEKIIKKQLINDNLEYKDMITHYSDLALPHVNLVKYKKPGGNIKNDYV
ncbi:hypothetical protein DRO69_14315 [Candidatus Bathyarchaeota archaeon]|nr:MAG: hypothetical protein DRO69_14315 [Candidatus Bathyarchaeota archaeon]